MLRQCCSRYQNPQICCMPMPAKQEVCCMPMQSAKGSGSACSFPCLIILILILLQFGRGRGKSSCCDPCEDPCGGNRSGGFGLDSGILFIIALYYLSCACPCS